MTTRPKWAAWQAARVEDIRWLVDSGLTGYEIADRFNIRHASLLRFLGRQGEHDLANRIREGDWQPQQHRLRQSRRMEGASA